MTADPAVDLLSEVPRAMREAERWILWKLEGDDKIPRQARSPKKKASSIDPSTWTSFDAALAALPASGCDGLGFVLGDGFTGVDLDACRDPGDEATAREWARRIVELSASYTEISPSGVGAKVFLYGDAPAELDGKQIPMFGGPMRVNGRAKASAVEIYHGYNTTDGSGRGRYFTVTGRKTRDAPAELSDGARVWPHLEQLVERVAKPSTPTPDAEAAIPQGRRDKTLTSLAGTMRRRGMGETEIRAALAEVNRRCRPPLPDEDVERIARSIAKKPPEQADEGDEVQRRLRWLRADREARKILAEEEGTARPEPHEWSLQELYDDPELMTPPPCVVPRLAWRGRVTLLSGAEKLGKSTLVGAAVAAITNGWDWLGESTDGVGDTVLWVTEEHPGDVAQRFRVFDADGASVRVRQYGGDPVAEVVARVREIQPALVVIDTLAAISSVYDPDSGRASDWSAILRPLVDLARETDAAIVILHHTTRDGKRYRDSGEIGAAVDQIVTMTGSVTSRTRRLASHGRLEVEEFAVVLGRDDYRLLEDTADEDVELAVIRFVSHHPGCSFTEARVGVGGSTADFRAALGRLVDAGTVVNRGPSSRHEYHVENRDLTPVTQSPGDDGP